MATQDNSQHWDEEADVVIVGYGAAGGVAAIAAHDAGAKVLIIEKMPHPGGISILSGGGVAFARSAEGAFQYLKRTCNGTTPDEVLRPLADGMVDIIDWVSELAKVSGTEPSQSEVRGHGTYPFPGTDDMDSIKLKDFPAYDAFPWAKGLRGGARLFKMVVDNVAARKIDVSLSTPAKSLVTGRDGEALGIRAERGGREIAIKARRAVVLCSGGFENNPEMKLQYFQAQPVYPVYLGNTGDGILMAQKAGAALWAHVALPRRLRLQVPGVSVRHPPRLGRTAQRQAQDDLDRGRPLRQALHGRVSARAAGHRGAAAGVLRPRPPGVSAHPVPPDFRRGGKKARTARHGDRQRRALSLSVERGQSRRDRKGAGSKRPRASKN
jgi:hypothetical protein